MIRAKQDDCPFLATVSLEIVQKTTDLIVNPTWREAVRVCVAEE